MSSASTPRSILPPSSRQEDTRIPGVKFQQCSVKEDTLTWRQRLAQYSPFIAEFMGCMFQALAWNCTELGKESQKEGEWKPLVLGLTLMISTYSFAVVSGAHLNPAVSLAVGLSNMGDWFKLFKYIFMQILGSAAGVTLSCLTYRSVVPTAVGPRKGYQIHHAFLVEFFCTAYLCTVYLNVMLSRSNNSIKAGNQFYGLAIGFALAAGVWSAEDISGAIFNPAVSLSVDFQSLTNGAGTAFLYMMAQFLGSFLAATTFRFMRPYEGVDDHDEWVRSQPKEQELSVQKLAAEGAGSFLVVYIFGMTTLSKLYNSERPFAAAATLTSMHYAVSDVSGGHFNPAVTLSVMFCGRGKCSIHQGVAYMVMHVFSGALAAFLYTAIRFPDSFPAIPKTTLDKYGYLSVSLVDATFAMVICYVFLATSTVKGIKGNVPTNYFSGLTYGLSSATGGFALLKVLNSLANPAMTLGVVLAFVAAGGKTTGEWVSIAGFQFLGSVGASIAFRITHYGEYRRLEQYGEDSPLVDKMGEKTAGGIMILNRSAAPTREAV